MCDGFVNFDLAKIERSLGPLKQAVVSEVREKIVLPLITIQQFAIQQLRNMEAGEKPYTDLYKKLVLRCMFGIINAARNSA